MARPCCEAIGCSTGIFRDDLFCTKHVVMIEGDTRKLVAKLWRPGKPKSAALERALVFARAEILFFVTNGHRMPQSQNFQWSDAPEESNARNR